MNENVLSGIYCFTICVCEILFHNLCLRNIVSQFGNDFDDVFGDVSFDDGFL